MPDSAPSTNHSGGRFFGSRKRRPSAPASKSRFPLPSSSSSSLAAEAPTVPTGPDSNATKPSSSSSHRRQSSRHSIAASVTGLSSTLRRSSSVEHKPRRPSVPAVALQPPEKSVQLESTNPDQAAGQNQKATQPAIEPKTPLAMLAVSFGGSRKEDKEAGKQSGASYPNNGQVNGAHPPPPVPPSTGGSQTPFAIYQHIHDTASKRISTLDYLRKAYEGRVYWFNTLLFSRTDLTKLPYFEAKKLSRRATNYLLLGLSIPAILDLNSQSPAEYLRALNSLFAEFDTYQSIHPPDGSTPSTLSRARIPQMFKRATQVAGGKGRRASSATDAVFLPNGDGESAASAGSSFPSNEHDLSPGKDYALLLTPSLPFEPDFYETFATLCDVLIDCYTKVMSLINSPEMCGPGIGDSFAKADSRVRKIIVAGVVREFEDASRTGAKAEVAGIGKVVLGGLM